MKVFTAARLRPGETKIIINDNQLLIGEKCFDFDTVLSQRIENEDLFQQLNLQSMIEQFKIGISQVLFCYGQTGSGKTYTVNELIPLILKRMFIDNQLEISCSVLQIYNEKILDMLYKQQLKLRFKNNEFTAENLTKFICHTPEDALQLFAKANRKRIVGSHQLNDVSSRSHCIYKIQGFSNEFICDFNIVDLAGSERINQTKVRQINESVEINKSLFYLRLVIQNLADKIQQIPYRHSKLTSLLKRSLCGKSNILMIICLNPSDENLQQSQQSASYGVKARSIVLQPELYMDDKSQQIKELKQQIIQLEQQLKIAQNTIKQMKNNTPNIQNQSNNLNMEHINQVNNLLNQNKKLREQIQNQNEQITQITKSNSLLNNENQDLRDKINIFEEIISEDLKKDKNPYNQNYMELFQGEGSNYIEIIINKLQHFKQFSQRQDRQYFPVTQKNQNQRNQRSFSIGKREFKDFKF